MILRTQRRGVTLIELLVTLALLALIACVTTLSIRRMEEPSPDDPARMLADSLRQAVATGRAATFRLTVNGRAALATTHPDGSVVADSVVPIDRLTAVFRDSSKRRAGIR
jgi:prepilin-type N-terminal cleavage/methylation domain-containing protein